MKNAMVTCLLMVFAVAGCNALRPGGAAKVSGVVRNFSPDALFAGCQVEAPTASPAPDADAAKGDRKFTGNLKAGGGKISLEKTFSSARQAAEAKIKELGATACDIKSTSPSANSRQTTITYQTADISGTMTLALQSSMDETSVAYVLTISEAPRAAPSGGGG